MNHIGLVVSINRENIDTDLIIPKQFLKSIKRTGFGKYLFYDLRYDHLKHPPIHNRNFILNKKQYQGASILITRKNFGCGSSREHAVWAIIQYGFKIIISSSYSDIFYQNCINNGLLPIILSEHHITILLSFLRSKNRLYFYVDLEGQLILTNKFGIHFDINPYEKFRLLTGIDNIKITLNKSNIIKNFEYIWKQKYPWIFIS